MEHGPEPDNGNKTCKNCCTISDLYQFTFRLSSDLYSESFAFMYFKAA